jgi:predicted nucleic acid-binding protein
MIVVADASPLIFLDKIRRLALIHRVFAGEVHVPTIVRDEVLGPAAAAEETPELESFLRRCRIEAVPRPRHFAGRADRGRMCAPRKARRTSG